MPILDLRTEYQRLHGGTLPDGNAQVEHIRAHRMHEPEPIDATQRERESWWLLWLFAAGAAFGFAYAMYRAVMG